MRKNKQKSRKMKGRQASKKWSKNKKAELSMIFSNQ